MSDDLESLWARYKTEGARDDRDALVLAHLPLVRYVAGRMMPGLHSSVELQDLVAYGVFGLIDAIDKFDLDAGVQFSTFATYRIRGEITDRMRDLAWEPRSVRQRQRLVNRTLADLERELGRTPTRAELATAADISIDELHRIRGNSTLSRMHSLSEAIGHEDGDGHTVADTLAEQAETELSPQMGEAASLMAAGVERLPDNERVLLQLIYLKGMTLKEIAKVLQVTESWVSLLHTRSMVLLQRTLSATA